MYQSELSLGWTAERPAGQAHQARELPDRIIASLFRAGLSVHAALDQPGEVARRHLTDVLEQLDDTIREVQSAEFSGRSAISLMSIQRPLRDIPDVGVQRRIFYARRALAMNRYRR